MKQFVKIHGSANGFTLLADREFVGRIWFGWLRRRGVKLVIRLREKDYFEEVCKQSEQLVSRSSFKKQVHRERVRYDPLQTKWLLVLLHGAD